MLSARIARSGVPSPSGGVPDAPDASAGGSAPFANRSALLSAFQVCWKTVSVTVGLRVARAEDASTLREIEHRAGEQFRRLNDIADHEPPSAETFVWYA